MNMLQPKLSVIIPVYKVEKYLDVCVQSVLNQTLYNIEIILVDDESPDACPKMCDQYAKNYSNVKVVHKKNGGLGLARNSGLEIATGEYVAFLDSDDIIEPYCYQVSLNNCLEQSLDAFYFQYSIFYSEPSYKPLSSFKKDYFIGDDVRQLLLNMIGNTPEKRSDRDFQMSSCCCLYRRSILEKRHIRFHSERELISEDLVFNMDFLSNAQKVCLSNANFYHYRCNYSSLTHTVRLDRIDKNHVLYQYVCTWLISHGFSQSEIIERAMRMTIGNNRSSMMHVCKSDLSIVEKIKWLKSVMNNPFWDEVKFHYPTDSLPLIQRIPLYFTMHKCPILFYFISILK